MAKQQTDPLQTCETCKKQGFHCVAHRWKPSWWWKIRYGQLPLRIRRMVPKQFMYGKFGLLSRRAPKWMPGWIGDQWIRQTRRFHIYLPADSRLTRSERKSIERAIYVPKSWQTNYGKYVPKSK